MWHSLILKHAESYFVIFFPIIGWQQNFLPSCPCKNNSTRAVLFIDVLLYCDFKIWNFVFLKLSDYIWMWGSSYKLIIYGSFSHFIVPSIFDAAYDLRQFRALHTTYQPNPLHLHSRIT